MAPNLPHLAPIDPNVPVPPAVKAAAARAEAIHAQAYQTPAPEPATPPVTAPVTAAPEPTPQPNPTTPEAPRSLILRRLKPPRSLIRLPWIGRRATTR